MTQQNRETLLALADRAEGATGPDRELDRKIQIALGRQGEARNGAGNWYDYDWHHYTASLDAAMSLVPEGVWAEIGVRGSYGTASLSGYGDGETYSEFASAASAPLALCAAALRATASSLDEVVK